MIEEEDICEHASCSAAHLVVNGIEVIVNGVMLFGKLDEEIPDEVDDKLRDLRDMLNELYPPFPLLNNPFPRMP